jgi:O-antigen/teichoic acid export membrane protein
VLAFLATVAIVVFFFDSFRIEPQHVSAGRLALLITGLNMSCILPLGVFSAVLFALERFDVVSAVTIVTELLRATLVWWFLRHGYGLVALALISLSLTLAQSAVVMIVAKRLYPPLRISLRSIDRSSIKVLFGFSIYRFIWIVAGQMIFQTDALVIGVFVGASGITTFAIAATLITYGRNAVSMVTDTLGPAAARMDATSDRVGLQRLLILGTSMALLVGIPVCLGFLFLGRQFITLWMGPGYTSSAWFLAVLTIPQFTSMAQYASAFVLAGIGKHRPLAFFMLAEAIANLLLSIFLVRKIGVVGAAWGTVIPHLICTAVVIPAYTLHVVGMRWRDYLVGASLRPALCAMPAAVVGYFLSSLTPTTWLMFVAEGATMCGVFAVMAYFICLTADQRATISEKLSSWRYRGVPVHGA